MSDRNYIIGTRFFFTLNCSFYLECSSPTPHVAGVSPQTAALSSNLNYIPPPHHYLSRQPLANSYYFLVFFPALITTWNYLLQFAGWSCVCFPNTSMCTPEGQTPYLSIHHCVPGAKSHYMPCCRCLRNFCWINRWIKCRGGGGTFQVW